MRWKVLCSGPCLWERRLHLFGRLHRLVILWSTGLTSPIGSFLVLHEQGKGDRVDNTDCTELNSALIRLDFRIFGFKFSIEPFPNPYEKGGGFVGRADR